MGENKQKRRFFCKKCHKIKIMGFVRVKCEQACQQSRSEFAEPRILFYTLMSKKQTYAYISKSVNDDDFNGLWLAEKQQKHRSACAFSNEVWQICFIWNKNSKIIHASLLNVHADLHFCWFSVNHSPLKSSPLTDLS